MKKIILRFGLLILFFVFLFISGCTEGQKINGMIQLGNKTLQSGQETELVLNLTYNPYLSVDTKEYRINLFVNGDHLSIYKDGDTINRNNAEVVRFDKENTNKILNYTIKATYLSSGKYVETISAYISTNEGPVRSLNSDFITITP